MAEPTTTELTEAAQAYIRASYARLAKDFDTPLPALSETATDQLRAEIEQAIKTMGMLGRSGIVTTDVAVADVAITATEGATTTYSCTETYRLSYDASDPAARSAKGVRSHTFSIRSGATGIVIESHTSREVSAAEQEAADARRDVSAGAARKSAKMEEESAKQGTRHVAEETEQTPGKKKKAILAVLGIALGALIFGYNYGPRTETMELSLHTGQVRTQKTLMYIPMGSDVQESELATWGLARMGTTPEEEKWIPIKVIAFGWFSSHGHISYPNRAGGAGMKNLQTLKALDAKDPEKADEAIARYKELLASLDVHDPAIVPSDEEVNTSKGKASTPYTAFASTLPVTLEPRRP